MIRTIHLYGEASRLGTSIQLDADNVQMLFAGLTSSFKGFRQLLLKTEKFALVKKVNDSYESITEGTLFEPFNETEELHFIPVLNGQDPSTAYAVASAMGATGAWAVVAAAVIYIGMIYAMSYLAASLAPTPEVDGSESADNQPSFMFNGAVNVTEEGYAVPVVFGRVLTGSVVISVGTEVENISLVAQDEITGSGAQVDSSGGV